MAQETGGIAAALGHAVPDGPGQPLEYRQGALSVQAHGLPPAGGHQGRAVEIQRIRPQTPQVEGLPLPADGVGELLRRLPQDFGPKDQMCEIIGHAALASHRRAA